MNIDETDDKIELEIPDSNNFFKAGPFSIPINPNNNNI